MKLRSLIPFNPYRSVSRRSDPFEAMRQEIDHMFEMRPFSDWGMGSVKIDIFEDDKGLTVQADIPGVKEDEIEITLHDTMLTIRGEKKAEKEEKNESFYMMERSFGTFSRSINLPYKADASKVEAEYKQGVLTIKLPRPKALEEQRKKIKVKTQTQSKSSKS